ncbi:MAG: lipase, partial [Oscillospiraceae bacterium]|nr:lipase [Oscillospiraceae bacterium]
MKKNRIRQALLICFSTLFLAACGAKQEITPERSNTEYIFVHGLSGWGSYDKTYQRMPYWGMLGGDLMKYLRSQGFSCYAASVSPEGSAWDRACELYAQLTGTVTDYGKAHSERCGHAQFGPDFTGRPLIPDWESGKKLVLLGHSFGGAT